jgi:hypothetical protein
VERTLATCKKLLTNFMKFELLMTRQNELDCAVIGNVQGLTSTSFTLIAAAKAPT